MSQITFPYANLDSAIQDKFAKIGGPAKAFSTLVDGYKGGIWRKESRLRRDAKIERAMKALEEHERKNGTKAERQLGLK